MNEKLFKAVETGNIIEVEKALTEEKINTSTYYGARSIILAVENGHFEILKMLLESGSKIPRVSFWSNSYNVAFSTLTRAVQNGREDILKLLLEYGANAETKDLTAPFIDALLRGNLEMTKMLLDAGANPKIKDKESGYTPLMFVILFLNENQEVFVELLLKAGAHVSTEHKVWVKEGRNKVLKKNTALTFAKERGDNKIVEMLKNAKKYKIDLL
jgi:ankyrin repeat protein